MQNDLLARRAYYGAIWQEFWSMSIIRRTHCKLKAEQEYLVLD